MPHFQEVLKLGEGVILDKVARRLIQLSTKAVDALANVMERPNQKGATQKRYAAQAILENVLKIWELRNIEQRIAELEARIDVS